MSRRKFLADGGFLFGAETLARLFAFSVTFVLARTVGLEALALLGVAQAILAYATVAGDAGLGTSAVRRIAIGEETPAVVRDTARSQILLSLIASIIVVPIVALQTDIFLALSIGSLPLIAAATTTYVLQGRLDAKGIAIARVTGNIVVGAVGMLLSLFALPLWAIAIAYPLGALVSMAIVNSRSNAKIREVIGPVNLPHLKAEAKPYLALALFTVILHSYSSCLLLMAQSLQGGRHFIEVALATRLLLLMVIPAQVLGSLLLPRYSAQLNSGYLRTSVGKQVLIALGGGLVIFAGVALNASWAVPLLFGPEASIAVTSVQVIASQVPISLVSTVLVALLLAKKLYLPVSLVYTAALVVQIACCLLLASQTTPLFIGSIVISELVFVLLLMLAVRKWIAPSNRR